MFAIEPEPESRYAADARRAWCRDCGAVVVDRVAHDRHHEVLALFPLIAIRDQGE